MNATTSPSSSRVTKRRERTRVSILDAAEELLAENPFASVRIEHIAAAADVSVGSVYGHFTNKDGVLLAVAERLAERAMTAMSDALDPAHTPLEAMAATGNAYCEFLLSNPVFVRYLCTEQQSPEAEAMTSVAERLGVLRDFFTDRVQAAIEAGEIRDVDPRKMANFLTGAWNGVAALSLRRGSDRLSREEIRSTLHQASAVIRAGLATS